MLDAARTTPVEDRATLAEKTLIAAVAATPLLYVQGFFEAFVVPKDLWTFFVVAPAAIVAGLRSPGVEARARTPLLCVGLYAAALLLPQFWATDAVAAAETIRRAGMLATYVLVGAALGPRRTPALIGALGVSAIAVLLLGLLRRHFGFPSFLPDRADVAIASTIGNSNALAEFAAPVGVAAAAAFVRGDVPRRLRGILACGAVGALALVFVSESRAGYLATAAGLSGVGVIFADRAPDGRRGKRLLFATAALAALFAAPLFLPGFEAVRERVESVVDPSHPTNEVRLRIWNACFKLFADAPMGVGGGRFDVAFTPYRDPVEWRISGLDTRVEHPHQEFLAALVEGGPLGFAAMILLFALAARRALRARSGRDASTVGAATIATLGVFGALAFFRAPTTHPSGVVAFLPLLAACFEARGRGPSGARKATVAALAWIVAAAGLSALDARRDLALGRAVLALNSGKGFAEARDVAGVREAFGVATASLRDVGGPLESTPRLFRAAAAAEELSALREGLEAAGEADAGTFLPNADEAFRLLETLARRDPRHPGATLLREAIERRLGRTAAAERTLLDAIKALPMAPRFRNNLATLYLDMAAATNENAAADEKLAAAERLLRREATLGKTPDERDRALIARVLLAGGSDVSTFGRLLVPVDDSPPPPVLDLARAAARDGRLDDARRLLLAALYDAPADGRLLDELAVVGFERAKSTSDPDAAIEAGRAFGRSRVRFALAAAAAGDLEQARAYVRLAVRKTPRLWDARFLAAKLAADSGLADEAADELQAWVDIGAPKAFVLARKNETDSLKSIPNPR